MPAQGYTSARRMDETGSTPSTMTFSSNSFSTPPPQAQSNAGSSTTWRTDTPPFTSETANHTAAKYTKGTTRRSPLSNPVQPLHDTTTSTTTTHQTTKLRRRHHRLHTRNEHPLHDRNSQRPSTNPTHILHILQSQSVHRKKQPVTLFTPHTAQANVHPQVKYNNFILPLNKTPGVTFDTMFCFGPHVRNTAARVQQRNSIMKALAGTEWGCDKETLTITYKAIGRSIINYAAPIYTPYITDTHWNRLQRTQNTALRIITGCHKMTHTEDLHRETNILPIKPHNALLSSQYSLTCHLQNHPNFGLTQELTAPRNKKPKVTTLYRPQFQQHLDQNNNLHPNNWKTGMKQLHTEHVQNTISTYPHNTVLNAPTPQIHKDEQHLSRNTRTTLAQLRTGYSKTLNSYMNRIDPNTPDTCTNCQQPGHTTTHLFNCPNKPTTLTPTDLWTKPTDCGLFLGLIPGGEG